MTKSRSGCITEEIKIKMNLITKSLAVDVAVLNEATTADKFV